MYAYVACVHTLSTYLCISDVCSGIVLYMHSTAIAHMQYCICVSDVCVHACSMYAIDVCLSGVWIVHVVSMYIVNNNSVLFFFV